MGPEIAFTFAGCSSRKEFPGGKCPFIWLCPRTHPNIFLNLNDDMIISPSLSLLKGLRVGEAIQAAKVFVGP